MTVDMVPIIEPLPIRTPGNTETNSPIHTSSSITTGAELNGRFADWYYVVSESDYKKLKVTITELIQPKTAGGAGTGAPQGGGFPSGGGFQGFQP